MLNQDLKLKISKCLNEDLATLDKIAAIRLDDNNYSSLLEPLENIQGINDFCDYIFKGIKDGSHFIIYGDYDVDGLTSTTIIYRTLKQLNVKDVAYYIPSRGNDGYGINLDRCRDIVNNNYDFVILVDNGVSQIEEIKFLKEHNIKVAIIDHHEIIESNQEYLSSLPFVHPCKRINGNYNSSAGYLSYMVSRKLLNQIDEYNLILGSLSIASDVMPLKEYNYFTLKVGLYLLNQERHRMCNISYLSSNKEKPIDEDDFGFNIVPKLNAFSRLNPDKAGNKIVSFLLSDDRMTVSLLANRLNTINERRKELVRNIVSTLGDFLSEKIIVVNLNDVNEGILGLIASSLSSKYCVPSIVLAKSKGTLKGSLRSYGDFSLTSLIDYLRPLLIKGGGHNEAGGISLKEENFAQLVASCKEYMKDKVIKKLPLKVIKLDACDLNEDLYEYINNLRPFGNGHEKVRFGIEFYSSQVNYIGARQEHIKVNFTAYQSLIGFNMSEQIHDINLGIGSVDKNIFNNKISYQLKIEKVEDIASSAIELI